MKTCNSAITGRLAPGASSLCIAAIMLLATKSVLAAPPAGISQSAMNQIGALFMEKASWTPIQAKLDSELIHAVKNLRGQPFGVGVPKLRLEVVTGSDGRVLVDITANVSSQLLALIRLGGGDVIASVPQFRAIRALVTLDQLEALAASPDVVFIQRAV